ncbi:MAG: 1-phosphofructokinase [Candidatus Fimenecus sp.]
MIYTVTFNPALDYVVHIQKLLPGEVNRTEADALYFGGKGINVSAVLKEIGVESVALGFTAGFTGKALTDLLAQAGIQTDFIELPTGNTRINVKIKAQTETDINAGGPPIPQEAFAALLQKLETLQAGDTLCLSGSIPASLPVNTYETVLTQLAGKDIRFAVDATGELLLRVLPFRPFLVKPNHHELAELLGRTLPTEKDLFDGACELQARGAKNVLVSRAGAGALLLTETGEHYAVPAVNGTVRNSVGAGDSMVAGFLAGYLQTGNYRYALQLGSAAGSATAFSEGLAKRDTIYEIIQKMQSE